MTRKSKPPIAIYSALADATRCRIVEILLAGPIPVHTLADAFSISRPAISRHLRVLKTAGLVAEVKKGRENLYALRTAKMSGAIAWLQSIVSPAGEVPQDSTAAEPKPMAMPIATPRPRRARPVPVLAPQATETVPERAQPVVIRPEPAAKAPPVSQMGFDF